MKNGFDDMSDAELRAAILAHQQGDEEQPDAAQAQDDDLRALYFMRLQPGATVDAETDAAVRRQIDAALKTL